MNHRIFFCSATFLVSPNLLVLKADSYFFFFTSSGISSDRSKETNMRLKIKGSF